MSKIVTQSLFHTVQAKPDWRSKLTSVAVHTLLLALALMITVPAVRESRKTEAHITLIAPQIPIYKPKTPLITKIEAPHLKVVPVLIPPVVKMPEAKPVVAEKTQPAVRPPVVKPPEPPPVVAKLDSTPPPPTAKAMDLAKAPPVPKVELGGFGDPNAVKPTEASRPAPVIMAKLGSFDGPVGSGQSGAAGKTGAVKISSFGSAEGAASSRNKSVAATVRTGGFGDGTQASQGANDRGAVKSSGFGDTIAAALPPKLTQTAGPVFTPVEILFKPKPAYSTEARNMRVEGQVSLEVVFQANGAVKVLRIIRGLGHGLDEAAQQAAVQVRFKPAMRAGVAIDQSATISITFELT